MSRSQYEPIARAAAARYGINPDIYVAQIGAESSWNPNARSPVGAQGIAQFMPGTARGMGLANPFDPVSALDAGARYFAQQLKTFGGSYEKALAAYNAGPGAVQKYGGIPPYDETQAYVKKIMSAAGGGGGAGAVQSQYGAPPPGQTFGQVAGAALGGGGGFGGVTPAGMAKIKKLWGQTQKEIAAGKTPSLARLQKMVKIATKNRVTTPAYDYSSMYAPAPQIAPAGAPSSVAPGGGWGGSEGIVRSSYGNSLPPGFSVTSAKRERRNTKSGGVSDHWTGNKNAYAHDIGWGSSQPTPASDALASRIVAAFGGPADWGKKGGNFKFTLPGGYSGQVIYRSNVGGNHWDHIHVGVRRSG